MIFCKLSNNSIQSYDYPDFAFSYFGLGKTAATVTLFYYQFNITSITFNRLQLQISSIILKKQHF